MKALILGSASLALLASLALTLAYPLNASAIGTITQIGATWYENQHNTTIGRMIALDSLGYAHCAWINAMDSNWFNRHIFYNYISESGFPGFSTTGTQVDNVHRAGFTVIDVGFGGRAFPCFHQMETQTSPNMTATAADLFPLYGAFLTSQAPFITGVAPPIWPTMQIGRNGRFHIIGTEYLISPPLRHYYISGFYDLTNFVVNYIPTWVFVDSTNDASADIATSPLSDKVAFAWIRASGDLYYLVDDDGLNPNFNLKVNLTQFTPSDTFRLHNDASVLIDQTDIVHLAFTTKSIMYGGIPRVNASIIWHWSSQYPDDFRVIANAYDPSDTIECGPDEVKAQRPSLGQDPTTGFLYCMYHQYDTDPAHLSSGGWPSGEVYISVSTDGGLNWSQGINITETVTPGGAPAGSCYSEYCPSMAKWVNGFCQILYVLDRDAGNSAHFTGAYTLNPLQHHKVPVDSILTTPWVPQNVSLHSGLPVYPIQVALQLYGALPMVIPPGGGSFTYDVTLTNVTNQPQTTDAWIMARLPSGAFYGPVLGPILNLSLFPNGSLYRLRNQYVPGNAPPGDYFYIVYVGDYTPPNSFVGDSSFYPFTKTGSRVRDLGSGDWTNTGESFFTKGITGNDEIHHSSFIIQQFPPIPSTPPQFSASSFERRVT